MFVLVHSQQLYDLAFVNGHEQLEPMLNVTNAAVLSTNLSSADLKKESGGFERDNWLEEVDFTAVRIN